MKPSSFAVVVAAFALGGSACKGSSSTSADAGVDWAHVSYRTAHESRTGFTVEVPTFLEAQSGTAEDDKLFTSHGIEIRAWSLRPTKPMKDYCKPEGGSTLHNLGEKSCWSTGRKSGRIFLHRLKHVGDFIYQLRFEYPDTLKREMDPVITRVEESWQQSPSEAEPLEDADAPDAN